MRATMPTILHFLLRVFLVAAGLVFAASLLAAFVFVLALWSLRALWARLTGRPVLPFVVRIDPRAGFDRMARRPAPSSARRDRVIGDVTDVEPK